MMAGSSSYNIPVHQLWSPPEGIHTTELDVVFFHGVQFTGNDTCDAWISTWTQRGHDDVCWAREWLPFDLGKAVRIFSVSYNAHVETSPHGDVTEIAQNVVQSLICSRYEWDHPIVLIGHGFGGLVLKSLVVNLKWRAIDSASNPWSKATKLRAKMFLKNVRGVAFYAVPHAGSSNLAEYVKKLLRCNNRHNPGIMDNIRPWRPDMEKLSVDFENVVSGNEINVFAFCEGKPMEEVGILVEVSSAQRLAGNNWYTVEDADHMEVCKPPSNQHPSYTMLVQFIIDCQQMARECDIQEIHDLPKVTFGLETYVDQVVTLLLSKGSNAAHRYVKVLGMGGVGKTLLLQTLYGSAKVRGHLQGAKFIWRTVGQNPNIMTLYRGLSEELSLNPELNSNAEEDCKLKLHTQFRLRGVFLVLDDVWQDKTFDLLDLAKGEGSVTLVSTRNEFLLAKLGGHVENVQMIPLSKEDSWNPFCVHAFGHPSHVPYELEQLAQSMAEQCQGLPLALKVIGSAMVRKTLPELEWKPLLKKLRESRMQETTVEEDLYDRLKIGYDLLPRRLKDCFLYFAAFPEACKIRFERILWYWIGEGLVPAHDGDDPKADAFTLLSKLWQRSFIEKNGESEWGQLFFKVHDVMRDLAFNILQKEYGTPPAKQLYLYRPNQDLEEIPGEWKGNSQALRLSLLFNNLKNCPENFNAPELLVLLLGENLIQRIPANFFFNLPKLKVLDLSTGHFDKLPEELGNLNNLIYLDISECENLQTLPATVGKLHMLKYLNIEGCRKLNIPCEVFSLTSLQAFYSANADIRGIEQRSILSAVWRLIGLTQLPTIDVKICHYISALTNLRRLHLKLEVKDLPAQLPYWCKQLEELKLMAISYQSLPSSFTRPGTFPSLIKFQLCRFKNFPEVHENSLPLLRTLEIIDCSHIHFLPLSLEILPNLKNLILINYCSVKLIDNCRKICALSPIWSRLNIKWAVYTRKNCALSPVWSRLNIKWAVYTPDLSFRSIFF